MSEENNTQDNVTNINDASAGQTIQMTSEDHQKLLSEVEKFKNEYLYLRAEFENYRRNAIKERSDLTKFASERIVKDLLDIMDNFDRALELKVTTENIQTYTQGVQMTAHELKQMLGRHGVQEVPAEGLPFDPSVHEALSSEPTDKYEPGFICRVFKKAYKLHDKIIRPAQVVVAKKPE